MYETDQPPLLVRLHDPDDHLSRELFLEAESADDLFILSTAVGRADCPIDIYERVCERKDLHPTVLACAAANPMASPELLARAFNYDKTGAEGELVSWAPRLEACGNPKLPKDLALKYRSFDWAEMLAYLNSGNALPEALAYIASLPLPEKGDDPHKELRVVARKIIARSEAREMILRELRQADTAEPNMRPAGLSEAGLAAKLGLGQTFSFTLRWLIEECVVRRHEGRLFLCNAD
jgi:hypothetical protein